MPAGRSACDRVQRIWRREGLKVLRKQRPRGRLWLNDGYCIGLRPQHRDHVRSYDFVEAQIHDGRKLRLMTLISTISSENVWRSGRPVESTAAVHRNDGRRHDHQRRTGVHHIWQRLRDDGQGRAQVVLQSSERRRCTSSLAVRRRTDIASVLQWKASRRVPDGGVFEGSHRRHRAMAHPRQKSSKRGRRQPTQ